MRRFQIPLLVVVAFGAGAIIGIVGSGWLRGPQSHFEAGFARIEACHVEPDDRTLVCATPVGAGDILLATDVSEEADRVVLVAHASIFIPNGFKNLSATLDTSRIVLTRPLAGRRIVDGASGKAVPLVN